MVVFDYRRKPWKEVLEFIESLKGKVVLDLGCGNGSYAKILEEKGFDVIGIDKSEELLNIARKRVKARFIKADMTKLPLEDSSVDNIIFIAAFHHLKNEEERIKCLNEVKRVLRENGRCLLSVWQKGKGDKYIKWRKEKRFYYFFTEEELKDLIKERFEIIKVIKSGDNLFVEFRKLSY